MKAPELFAWGRDGIPPEFEHLIQTRAINAKIDQGEAIGGIRTIGFEEEGVSLIAAEQVGRLLEARARSRGKRSDWPKLTVGITSWCYGLHAYCAKFKAPAPPALLALTFACLGLAEHQPALELERAMGVVEGVRKIKEFSRASALDGEADSAGEPLTANALAKAVGVDHKTIADWRSEPAYQRSRRFSAMAHDFWAGRGPDHGWGPAFEKLAARTKVGNAAG